MKDLFYFKLKFTLTEGKNYKAVSHEEAERLCNEFLYQQMDVYFCHTNEIPITKPPFLERRQNLKDIICQNAGILREYIYNVCGVIVPEYQLYNPAEDMENKRVRKILEKTLTVNWGREKLHHIQGMNLIQFVRDNPSIGRIRGIPADPVAKVTVEQTEAFNKLPLQKRINYFMSEVNESKAHAERVQRIKSCLEIADRKRRDECLKNNCKL